MIKIEFIFIGKDVFHAGVATHFCEFARLGDLEEALVASASSSEVDDILNQLCPVDKLAKFSWQPHMQQINECFSGDSVEEIFVRLEQDNSTWAQQSLEVFC